MTAHGRTGPGTPGTQPPGNYRPGTQPPGATWPSTTGQPGPGQPGPGQFATGQPAAQRFATGQLAATPQAAPGRRRRGAGSRRSVRAGGTPAILRALLIGLALASLAWGAVSAWTVSQHSSAASAVISTSEPLSLAAQGMYQSLADADVTATTTFLAGPPEPLAVRQHYEADIAQAAADLAVLRTAGPASAGRQLAASLSAVSTGLPLYTGYVQQAQTYSSLGYPLTGGSFMQVASEEMHLTLLPAARASYAQKNAALTTASAQATGLPWIVVIGVLGIAIGVVLLRTQRWLRRRTHRVVNYGLLTASLATAVGVIWLVVAFASARADLQRGLNHGATAAETLAQASIAAQRARGDQVLNLISRSGSTSFQQDFLAMRADIGPGPRSLLAAADKSSTAGRDHLAATALDAHDWYAVAGRVFRLDLAASYADETRLVIGTGSGGSAAEFGRLEADLGQAITADQVVFADGATAGSNAFGGLEAGLIVAALLMAAGSAWGLSRRLAEYR